MEDDNDFTACKLRVAPGGARQRKQKRLVSASLHEADGAAAGVRRS